MMRKIAVFAALVLMTIPACASAPETPSNDVDAGSAQSASPSEKGGPPKGGGDRWAGPDFTVETFDGETFTLAEQAGTPVVLNFWESW